MILSSCNAINIFSETEENILDNSLDSSWAKQGESISNQRNIRQSPNLMLLSEKFIPNKVSYFHHEGTRSSQTYQSFLGSGVLSETLRVSTKRPSDILELPDIKDHALYWTKLSGKAINWGKMRYYNSKFSPVHFRAARVGSKKTVCVFFNMPYDISKRDHFERPKEAIFGYFCIKEKNIDLAKVKNVFDGFSFSGKSARSSIGQLFTKAEDINNQAVKYYSQNVQYISVNNPALKDFPLNLVLRIDITDNVLKAD